MGEPYLDDIAAIGRIGVVERILEVVCRTTGLGFSAVARVTPDRWIACAVRDEIAFGLKPGGELSVETTICDSIRDSRKPVAIDNVSLDRIYCNHPTPKQYGFQSYISVPITLQTGEFFGTLCAIDPKPAHVTAPATIGMFTLFADLIAMHLDSQQRVAASEAALLNERTTSQLREQFIAVLGHDLRNPLSAISSATDLLRRLPKPERSEHLLSIIKRSVGRMSGLINDVLDFARGRLGDGLSIRRVSEPDLAGTLQQIVNELQTAWPDRKILIEKKIDRPIICDAPRVGQMLSNLLANALAHGSADTPVTVRAQFDEGTFEMSVTNNGETIPRHIVDNLFQPFARGTARPGQEGLGLGLYIASEIARAHDGSISVRSVDGETRFTFVMPAGT